MRHFPISLSIAFLSQKILGFLFSTKNRLTWESECENLTSENLREFTSWSIAREQAFLLGEPCPSGLRARSSVLARLASLAQIGELARRLVRVERSSRNF